MIKEVADNYINISASFGLNAAEIRGLFLVICNYRKGLANKKPVIKGVNNESQSHNLKIN